MAVENRSEMKWLYLLEKCNVCLHILGPTSAFPRALYNILSIQPCSEETEEAISSQLQFTETD